MHPTAVRQTPSPQPHLREAPRLLERVVEAPYAEGIPFVGRHVRIAYQREAEGELRGLRECLALKNTSPNQLALHLHENLVLAGPEDVDFEHLRFLVDVFELKLVVRLVAIRLRVLRRVFEKQLLQHFRVIEALGVPLKERQRGPQPAEQLGGVKTTIANYLKCFTEPEIAEVFCPAKSTFSFDDIDHGKIICVSIPQRFGVERRYVNTLLKLTFYAHALRRFDKPARERANDNLIILWADEAQKIVTASEDGMSDYNVVDVIREARATVVAATQSYASLIPPMGDERKAKVFIANMANRVTFCAADEDSAKLAADTLGKRKSRRRTTGWSGGKRTTSMTEEDRYHLEPHELRRLKRFQAVVQHCDHGFRRVTIPPLGTDGRVPEWHRRTA